MSLNPSCSGWDLDVSLDQSGKPADQSCYTVRKHTAMRKKLHLEVNFPLSSKDLKNFNWCINRNYLTDTSINFPCFYSNSYGYRRHITPDDLTILCDLQEKWMLPKLQRQKPGDILLGPLNRYTTLNHSAL